MKYDFDKVVDRHGTNCLKYDFAIERGKPADILPLWVADMDFQTAPAILERLEETVKHVFSATVMEKRAILRQSRTGTGSALAGRRNRSGW